MPLNRKGWDMNPRLIIHRSVELERACAYVRPDGRPARRGRGVREAVRCGCAAEAVDLPTLGISHHTFSHTCGRRPRRRLQRRKDLFRRLATQAGEEVLRRVLLSRERRARALARLLAQCGASQVEHGEKQASSDARQGLLVPRRGHAEACSRRASALMPCAAIARWRRSVRRGPT